MRFERRSAPNWARISADPRASGSPFCLNESRPADRRLASDFATPIREARRRSRALVVLETGDAEENDADLVAASALNLRCAIFDASPSPFVRVDAFARETIERVDSRAVVTVASNETTLARGGGGTEPAPRAWRRRPRPSSRRDAAET